MASGDEGLLTLSTAMWVSPEPGAIELLRRYSVALNYAIDKILSLIPLTAPQMIDVNPNRWGEPMNRPKGTPALQGGEEVRCYSPSKHVSKAVV